MIDLGLTAEQNRDLFWLLRRHHDISIGIRLLDTSHKYYQDLSRRFLDGTVTIDADAENADRALDLTVSDPKRSIQVDPDAPSPSSVFINHMISVIYRVSSPDKNRSYDIPVFCGPIDDVQRNGPILSLKCLGKEVLSLDALWTARTIPKGTNKVIAIKRLLQDAGELKFNLPDHLTAVLREDLALARGEAKPWSEARKLANSMGWQLFYDGRGVATMRPLPYYASQTFDFRVLKQEPQYKYDLSSVSNAVQVTGAIPKGSKTPLIARRVAPDTHPLSPRWIGRNFTYRYLNPIFIEDQELTTQAAVDARANDTLNDALLEAVDATADAIPMPLTEPNDVAFISWGGFGLNNRLKKVTIPLRNSGSTTIGYLRRVRPTGGPVMRAMR